MNEPDAVAAFGALAHEHRLKVFRLLIRRGPEGMPAGDVASELQIPPSSLSFHLGQLQRAGLIRARRNRRQIIYAADLDGMRRLLAFLTDDCCDGNPEICAQLMPAMRSRKTQ